MNKKNKPQNAEYYVDFESWHIMAESRDDAIRQALAKLEKGEIPEIVSTELV